MKHLRLLLAFAGGLALVLIILVTLNLDTVTAAPSATTRYVLGSGGSDSSNCTNAQKPCKTIQYALSQAGHGDTIQVAKGLMPVVYAETLSIDKSVTLEGGWGAVGGGGHLIWQHSSPCDASWTTIDAGGAGRAISITGSIAPIIDCFTITGGDAAGLGGDPGTTIDNDAGGGIYSRDAAPIISNNVITGNYGCDTCPASYGRGGGIYMLNAPATAVISNNLIAGNVADESTWGQGGGIMLRASNAQVLSNTITDNRAGHSAGYGGGITVRGGSPTIADNAITSNRAGQSVQGLGGGIYVWSKASVTIERNVIEANQAILSTGTGDPSLVSRGGGIYFDGELAGVAIIRNNVIYYNTASPGSPQRGEGGGIYLTEVVAPSQVKRNTIYQNYGGFNYSGDGGGIYVNQSDIVIKNNKLFDNSATWTGPQGEGGGLYINGGTALIQSNVITRNHGAGFGSPSTATGYGGGMAISGSLTSVLDNRIVGNNGSNAENWGIGGGIYAYEGTLHIAGNTIAENRASAHDVGYGGGLYLDDASPTLERNVIVDNVAAVGASGRGGGVRIYWSDAFTITNNIIARNAASEIGSGIAIDQSSGGLLAHNTIAENASGDGIGVCVQWNSTASLINNIIVSHTVGILNADPATSAANASFTLFEANTTNYSTGVGNGNQVPGPAALLSNYHLSVSSNAVDQGLTLAWVTDDIDGDLRTYGAAPDVGADEVSCLARVGGVNHLTIQAAVDAASSGQTVQVAEGTCYENVSIAKSVTIQGGWNTSFTTRDADPASASTIDGMGAGRVVSITEVSGSIAVTIDGFTITGGDATGLGGATPYFEDIGGGIYSRYADTTVIDCVVTGNVAGTASTVAWGGGIAAFNGNFTLQDSTLANNTASSGSNGYGGGACFRFGSATLTGNTIENNTASTASSGFGGGLWLANNTVTLQDNTVRNNTASIDYEGRGGGIEVRWGSASLDGDVIEGNRAVVSGLDGYGGAVATREGALLTVENAQIYDNSATFGGGVYIEDGDDSVISGTLIYSNTGGMGGGVYVTTSTNVSLAGNQVYGNLGGYAGGILLNDSPNATLEGNYVHDNAAWGLGGGLWIASCDNARLTNNIIVENRLTSGGNGAGVLLFNGSTAHFEHTTLARNSGGDGTGLYIVDGSQAWMTNTIVASHTVGVYVDSGCTLILEATLWGDGAWANVTNKGGSGDIKDGEIIVVGDPGFVDPDGVNSDDWDDYHIGHTSEAKDAGLDVGVATDIDGDIRPIGPAVDIGADEAWLDAFFPLTMKDS